jgi:3-carboxy-cis,cis-muconate cycloisomerase
MPPRLIESLSTTTELAEIFSDESVLQAMLDFEAALARAEARVGLVPRALAEVIMRAADAPAFDYAAIARETLRAGTPGIPVSKALTQRVRSMNAEAADFVHWGATSQDVADTAMVLLLKRAHPVITDDLARVERSLRKLSDEHKNTVMLGRTLMQAAPPITFGLKVAGWLGAIHRSGEGFDSAFEDVLILQFGGASGTLASLGERGLEVAQALAEELGLACPDAPWHAHRDRFASLLSACGVLTGALGKMAQDISLLMQSEVAEVAEPGDPGRGGSSTMPHKKNPIGCVLTLAAAARVPGLVAAFLTGMIQEHERAAGGWQAEWPIVASVIQSTGLAASSMAEVAERLSVDAERMRANIAATRGVVFAERAMMLLAPKLGREGAHKILEEAVQKSIAEKRHLTEILASMPAITKHLDAKILVDLEEPEKYLGSAEAFRAHLLSTASGTPHK